MDQNHKFWVCLSAYGLSLCPLELCASQLWSKCVPDRVRRFRDFAEGVWGMLLGKLGGSQCETSEVWKHPAVQQQTGCPNWSPDTSSCTHSALHFRGLVSLIDQCLKLWYWALLTVVSGCTLPLTAVGGKCWSDCLAHWWFFLLALIMQNEATKEDIRKSIKHCKR